MGWWRRHQYKNMLVGKTRGRCILVERQNSKERRRNLGLAQLRIQAVLYLLDREAIESGLILWLNEHG
ncbi:hypothetical protein BJX96DRAFT_154154 [Aspergillus floccosus]